MTRAITSDELVLLRSAGQWSKLYMAVLKPNTVYTARLASAPASNDQVYEIAYNTGSGTLANVKAGMTILVGTTAGARDLGLCRVRVEPDGSKFYIGEISEIDWISNPNCYLTVIDDFDIWARHIHVDGSGGLLMDVNIAYSDQHLNFDPVPVLGTHACLWLTGASVAAHFDASDSWVFDSTISGHSWSAPGSSSSSGMTSATPTINYNAAGIYRVMDTVTAANGKTAMGARYVFVFDDDNPPATVFQIANCEGSMEAGGWMFDVTMQAEATLTDLREGTLAVLFAKDYFNGVEQSIGPLTNRENIVCVGRVGPSESIRWDPVAGQVHFNVQGPHYWLNKIKVSACQLDFTGGTPASWGQVKNLTTDKALWHLLHWRSTATIVMDFYPTNDSLYDVRFASLANYLWGQLNEFAGLKLLAQNVVDEYGRLFTFIDPQIVAYASRSGFPTVMTVTTQDWQDTIEFERQTVHETGHVNISTRDVNSAGVSVTLYSLSPGHIPKRHGDWLVMDGLLSASQSASNQKAGLLLGWKNNEFPDFPIKLAMNNRFISNAPRQYLSITVDAADTPRGVGFSGRVIPRRVRRAYDAEARLLSTEVNCEGETFEQPSANGDIPGDGDVDLSIPPLPSLPPLPPLPPIVPGGFPPSAYAGGPPKVILHDTTYGLLYSENFDQSSPNWVTINAGLTSAQYQSINVILLCPNGALYVAYVPASVPLAAFIARAPSVGGTFTVLYDCNDPALNLGATDFQIWSCAINPLVSESFAFIMGPQSNRKFYLGAGGTYAAGATMSTDIRIGFGTSALSYGMGAWIATGQGLAQKVAANGASILANITLSPSTYFDHLRPSTLDVLYMQSVTDLYKFTNSMATGTLVSTTTGLAFLSGGPSIPINCDCDPTGLYMMGRVFVGAKGKSSDGGATFLTLGSLPPGTWWFRWAGNTGSGASVSRWIAAGGSAVRLSLDFGSTWLNREGDLLTVAPLPTINMIRVVDYG